jgi:hypothetical protein
LIGKIIYTKVVQTLHCSASECILIHSPPTISKL